VKFSVWYGVLNHGVSEFARVFGVDFFSVISRGSQFKVESFMFRIAKPESFVLLSPSKQDVRKNTLNSWILLYPFMH
jgi:DNA polymerase elongation subunit (family B)